MIGHILFISPGDSILRMPIGILYHGDPDDGGILHQERMSATLDFWRAGRKFDIQIVSILRE